MSPTSRLIECPKPSCAKKFRDLDALKYHLSYAHNDLKKAAAIAAEKRQKLLSEKTIKAAAAAEKKAVSNNVIKKEIKEENGKASAAAAEVKPPQPLAASKSEVVKKEEPHIPAVTPAEKPLDLQKRPISPAYSDISDEEPPPKQPLLASVRSEVTSVPLASNLPSLNNLARPGMPTMQPQPKLHQPQQPPPAHSSSLKKPPTNLSLEESLKRPPQFLHTGFPPHGFPGLPGLPAHLAAAVASGRYPPGFMPVPPPAMSVSGSVSRSPYTPYTAASLASTVTSSASSASAKLQELQDRVMASSRPSLHLGSLGQSLMSSASSNPTSTMTSFSTLARDLLQQQQQQQQGPPLSHHHAPPSAHYSSLSRMAAAAGSLNAAGM